MARLTILHLQRRRRRSHGQDLAARWRHVKATQGGRCAFCGARTPLTVDHILPISMGGTNARRNLRGLCVPCHRALNRLVCEIKPETSLLKRLALAAETVRGGRESLFWTVAVHLFAAIACRRIPLLRVNHAGDTPYPTAPYGLQYARAGVSLPVPGAAK